MKEIDLSIEEIRSNLKKTFFNSIMSSRELIRTSGFIQLKVQNKTQSKRALVEKLGAGVREDVKILRVVREFRSTYSRSKKEIERRAKFDYLMIGLMRVMMSLVKEENSQRKKYLKDYSTLLPQSYCPFLTNYISEQILRQLEEYFSNDTSVDELETAQVENLESSCSILNREGLVFGLKSLLEQYMLCSDSLAPVHRDFLAAMSPESHAQSASTETGLLLLKVKAADLQALDCSPASEAPYVSLLAEVDLVDNLQGCTSYVLRSLTRK